MALDKTDLWERAENVWIETAKLCLLEMLPNTPLDDIGILIAQAIEVRNAGLMADGRNSDDFAIDEAVLYVRQMTLMELNLRVLKRLIGMG